MDCDAFTMGCGSVSKIQARLCEWKACKNQYLLEKISYCSSCGSPMSARTGRNKKWVVSLKTQVKYLSLYYTCGNVGKHRANPCTCRRTHNARDLEPRIWERVVDYLANPEFVMINEKVVREDQTLQKAIESLKGDIKSLEVSLVQTDEEMKRLLQFLVKRIISEDEFLAQKKDLLHRKQQIEKRKSKVKIDLRAREKLLSEVDRVDMKAIKNRYEKHLDSLGFDEKRSVVLAVVKQVLISNDNQVQILFRPLG